MALTALMFVILLLSFALMVGLVKFTENIIARPDRLSADEPGGAASEVDTEAIS